MNIAGAIGYLLHRDSPIAADLIAEALDAVADEPVDPDLLSAVATVAEGASSFFQPILFEELRATGRSGLFTLDGEALSQALANSPNRPPGSDPTWAKAIEIGPEVLVYPQDRRPEVRLVVWAPVAVGPEAVRLNPLDLGVDVRTGRSEPPAVEPQPCAIVFSGLGNALRKTCAPGSCDSVCDKEWKVRGPDLWLFGCSCPRG